MHMSHNIVFRSQTILLSVWLMPPNLELKAFELVMTA